MKGQLVAAQWLSHIQQTAVQRRNAQVCLRFQVFFRDHWAWVGPTPFLWLAVCIEVCCFAQLHCCCSFTKWCQTVCDPMDCSTPCVPVFHHLLAFAQTHVHRVSNAIQPSCLSFPSPSAFSLYQLQGLLFKSGGQSIGASASLLPVNIQDWFPIELTGLISLLSKELSRVCSSTTVWKHQLHKNTFFTDMPLSKCSQGSLSVS